MKRAPKPRPVDALSEAEAKAELKRLAAEIARMLSGRNITTEARAAAASLIAGGRA